MVAQHGIRSSRNPTPIRHDALAQCLHYVGQEVLRFAFEGLASVHMPRIGCGLAGGTWDRVEPLIVEHLVQRGVLVTVYDLP
jgi:O-acetyl-ADP-ribose deacetylase (regulator of RNase III)